MYSIPSRKYGQLEDKNVITKFENHALLQLGEKGIRFSHSKDVQPYKSDGPTESKPKNYDTRPLTNEEKGNNSM